MTPEELCEWMEKVVAESRRIGERGVLVDADTFKKFFDNLPVLWMYVNHDYPKPNLVFRTWIIVGPPELADEA